MDKYFIRNTNGEVVDTNDISTEKWDFEEQYAEDFDRDLSDLLVGRFGFSFGDLTQPCTSNKDSKNMPTIMEYLSCVAVGTKMTSTVGFTANFENMVVACSHRSALEQAKACIYEEVYEDWSQIKIQRTEKVDDAFVANNLKIDFVETTIRKHMSSKVCADANLYEVCAIITFLGTREVKTYLVKTFEL